MNTSLLEVLGCPEDQGVLELNRVAGTGDSIAEGSLRCVQCGEAFEIRDGIPVFVKEADQDVQGVERQMRERDVARFLEASEDAVLSRIAEFHWIPLMRRQAQVFSRRFEPSAWVLDGGVGLGWHWESVSSPNIIGLDFVFSNLQIAKRSFLESRIDSNIHLVCADLSRLPLKKNAINGVWSVQALQHLPPDKLVSALGSLRDSIKEGGYLEIYWLNYNVLLQMANLLRLRRWPRQGTSGNLYTRYVIGSELKQLLARYFTAEVKIRYNELLFHPEMRLRHRLPLGHLDKLLAGIPVLNGALARQVTANVRLS